MGAYRTGRYSWQAKLTDTLMRPALDAARQPRACAHAWVAGVGAFTGQRVCRRCHAVEAVEAQA